MSYIDSLDYQNVFENVINTTKTMKLEKGFSVVWSKNSPIAKRSSTSCLGRIYLFETTEETLFPKGISRPTPSGIQQCFFFHLLGKFPPTKIGNHLDVQKYASKSVEKTGTGELFSDSCFTFIKTQSVWQVFRNYWKCIFVGRSARFIPKEFLNQPPYQMPSF